MKAYHIMMFLLIFNLFGLVIRTGLGIYDLSGATADSRITLGADLLTTLATFTILGLVGGVVAGAIIGNLLKIEKSAQGYVYGFFTSFFWTSYGATLQFINTMIPADAGTIWVYVIFTGIIGYIFAAGLFQMVTGGWKTYE